MKCNVFAMALDEATKEKVKLRIKRNLSQF